MITETMGPVKAMWTLGILLGTAACVASFSDHAEVLNHGRQLKIYLPKNAEKLEFRPLGEPTKSYPYWDKREYRTMKGRVSGTGTDRRWYLDKVTFDDQGSYVQKDFWNRDLSVLNVKVTLKRGYLKRVAGETLTIPLEGLDISRAELYFTGDVNATLVQQGAPVAQDLPDYWNRVKAHSTSIEITNVNVSDVGYYTLQDQRGRTISVNRLELVDHHEGFEGNPLMALLLLLGIPAGICCCCRKKIFKKKAAHTATIQTGATESLQPPSQPPGYNTPGVAPAVHPPPNPGYQGPPNPGYQGPPNPGYQGPPNPGYQGPPNPGYQGPPNPGYQGPPNPGYQPAPGPGFNAAAAYPPPQNPLYPPIGPAMSPVQPAMGYAPAPVMYSAPPPGENIHMENMSPADPLLTPPQPPAVNPAAPPGDASSYQFQVDGGKNFL